MKKGFYVIVLVWLNVLVLDAQVTISHQSLPLPGDTFALRYDVNPSILIGNPGISSQHWDFTTMAQDSIKFATYGFTSSLAFASQVPTSNLYTYGPSVMYGGPGTPVNSIPWGWMLFNTNNDGMTVIGYRTGDGPNAILALHDVPLMLAKTPFTLNDTYSQNSKWTVNFNRVQGVGDVDTIYTSFISSSLVCDAWGTISIPTESNVDVVRLREYRIAVDSIYAMLNGSQIWKTEFKRDTVNNYQYYSPLKHHAIATVYCRPDNSVRAAEYLYYSDIYTDNIETVEVKQLKLSPNPVRDALLMEVETPYTSVIIMTPQGQIVKAISNFSTGEIDVSNFSSGLYLIVAKCGSVNFTGKFIKE